MTDLTDYAENILIDALFRNSTISRPASWFIALSTTTPTDAGGNITEPTGDANYARQAVDTGASSEWSDPAGGSATDNSLAIVWPAADSGFGTVTHVVFFDLITAGNAWFWKNLASSVTVNAGEVFQFPIGDLDVAFD